MPKVNYIWRDAGTGRFISAQRAAKRKKNTVVRERRKPCRK